MKICLEVAGLELELSEEEARELYEELYQLYGPTPAPVYIPPVYIERPIREQHRWYPEYPGEYPYTPAWCVSGMSGITSYLKGQDL